MAARVSAKDGPSAPRPERDGRLTLRGKLAQQLAHTRRRLRFERTANDLGVDGALADLERMEMIGQRGGGSERLIRQVPDMPHVTDDVLDRSRLTGVDREHVTIAGDGKTLEEYGHDSTESGDPNAGIGRGNDHG